MNNRNNNNYQQQGPQYQQGPYEQGGNPRQPGYPPQGQPQGPQGGQQRPPQGYPPQGQGYPPQGQGYPPQGQAPAQAQRSGDSQINLIFKDIAEWFKSFFTIDFTAVIEKAKNSSSQYTWLAVFLVYFILYPLMRLFNVLGFSGSLGYNLGTWGLGFLRAILLFLANAAAIVLGQLIFKTFDSKKLTQSLNVAAASFLPHLLYLPFGMIFGSIHIGFFDFVDYMLTVAAQILSYFLIGTALKREAKEGNNMPAQNWIIVAMLLVYVLIRYLAGMINMRYSLGY